MKGIDFLNKELDIHIERFDKESKRHKKMYRSTKYIIFVLTALSTILAGIAVGSGQAQYYLNICIIITTAAIGVANSFDGLRKPGKLWTLERNIYYSLKDLKRELMFDLERNEEVAIEKYFDRFQAVLNAAGEKWTRNVEKNIKVTN